MAEKTGTRRLVNKKQIALVQLARKRLGFDDGTLLSVLFHRGQGALHVSELDQSGFEGVMAYCGEWGFRSDWMQRTFGKRPGMASPRQIDLIRDLWREWLGRDDDAALNAWLERSYHVSALRFLTSQAASSAIAGLKAMKTRKKDAGSGSNNGE